MAGNLIDSCIRLAFLALLVARQSGAQDEEKAWLWKLLTSTDEGSKVDQSSYTSEEGTRPALSDILRNEVLSSRFQTELNQNDKPTFYSEREKQKLKRGFGGLLCCNYPPTRPPLQKKNNSKDDRFKDWIMLQLLADGSDHVYSNDQGEQDVADSYPNYYDIRSSDDGSGGVRGDNRAWRAKAEELGLVGEPNWSKRAKVTGFLNKRQPLPQLTTMYRGVGHRQLKPRKNKPTRKDSGR